MKKIVIFFTLLFLLGQSGVLYSQTPDIIQCDTIAIKGMPLQPVLKIHIFAPASNLTLSKLVIKSYCEDFADVDSIIVYRTTYNRFSKADYENDWISNVQLLTNRRSFSATDSLASFRNMTYSLQPGDNYFWILLDLSKSSVAGHYLKVTIPKDSIIINGVNYPDGEKSSIEVPIRQVYFSDNFDNFNASSLEPNNWTQEILESDYVGPVWQSQRGGYGSPDNIGNRNPNISKSGAYNARLVHPYFSPYVVLLKSKPIDLILAKKPSVTFYHAQMDWYKAGNSYIDSLGVYYKIGATGQWKFLKGYTSATPVGKWVKREIILPDEADNENFYLGFKGTAQWGFGVCIDSVMIIETAKETRDINSIIVSHPKIKQIFQGAIKSPVIRVNVRVKGNEGAISLNSLTITSGNTDNGDLSASGVRLFSTADSIFESPKPLGTAQAFLANEITFSSLNKKIETGNNYLWITYDVKKNATPDDILDISIKAGGISFSGTSGTWPAADLSPDGNLIVRQSIFFDDFETDKNWNLGGEFQRDLPKGKGGKQLGGDSYGRSDPSLAYSNSYVMGTDLLNDGDYANGLTSSSCDTAVSPLIEAQYFKNTQLNFYRWLNIDSQDSAIIEYKYEGESNWRFLWGSKQNEYQESYWHLQEFNTKQIFDRKNFRIRFRLGPTSVLYRYSGWNIDYLFVTGDSIRFDAAVTNYNSPKSACKLTSSEKLNVTVRNTGPKPLVNIPIKASVDGGKTWVSEIINETIAKGGFKDYEFTTSIDLSNPSIYNVIVKVAYPGDNFPDNDSVIYKLTSIPTYSLPYKTGFEKDTSFWEPGGLNSSWFQGKPSGNSIRNAAEGFKCWKTNDYYGRYIENENSYVESPCFNFTGTDKPIIDFQSSFRTQFKDDGAILEYSLDQGTTWNYVSGDTLQFSWKWYNDIIAALSGKKGWTGLTGGAEQPWHNSKHYLSEIAKKDDVKFRFVFKSSNPPVTIPRDGFAFDDFRLYEAPFDAGVVSIDNLTTPACQFTNPTKLQVTVKNYGIRDIKLNDTIFVGIKVNKFSTVIDTFKLTSDLVVGADQQFTMKKPVNMVASGNYTVKAFVIEKLPYFYNTNNDTAQKAVEVYPNPITNLADTIYTARVDTVVIKTVKNSNYLYDWKYGGTTKSTVDTLDASKTGFGDHLLLVEQNDISHCKTRDSVFIKTLIPDIGVVSIISPVTDCGYKLPLHPVIRIKNFGTDTMRVIKNRPIIIPVRIKLNTHEIIDTVRLTQRFSPHDVVEVTLDSTLNLMAVKTDTLKISTKLYGDNTSTNDTTTTIFQIKGYPKIFLGNDTSIVGKLTYVLDAGSGFTSWKWSDNVTETQTFTVTKPGDYAVTITDNNNCSNSDTIHVHLKIHDLTMQKLMSPVDACTQTATTGIKCQIINSGTDTIETTEPVILWYKVNKVDWQKDTIKLLAAMKPNETLQHIFKQTLDMSYADTFSFTLKTLVVGDMQPLNDSLLQDVKVFGNPSPDLGITRVVQQLTDTLRPSHIKYDKYLWQDGSTDSIWVVTKNKMESSFTYAVTVTDKNGCTERDTVFFRLLINDLEVTSVSMVENACSLPGKQNIEVTLTNTGNSSLTDDKTKTEDDVSISYSLNGGALVKDDTTYSFIGPPGKKLTYRFKAPVDMSAVGSYSFKFFMNMSADIQHINDTATFVTHVYGYPKVNFKTPDDDTVWVKFPYTLHAGPGYPEYLWQDFSTDSLYTISNLNYNPSNQLYKVLVTGAGGCSTEKSITVIEAIYDLGIDSVAIPSKICAPTSQKVGVVIMNNSTVKILSQPVILAYSLDGGASVAKLTNVSLNTGEKVTVDFDENINLATASNHHINVSLTYLDDENSLDNTEDFEFNVYGKPLVDFGAVNDTIKATSLPVTLDAGDGFVSYKWKDNSSDRFYSANAEDYYSVVVKDNNECSAKDSVYVRYSTGTNSLEDKADIKVYPNPASDYIIIMIELEKKQNLDLDIISQEGKVIFRKKLQNMAEYRQDVDVSVLPKGLYYVRVHSDDSIVTQKVVIK